MVLVVVDFCALGGRCARRDWHTGKRKGEGEGGKAKILGFGPWSLVLMHSYVTPADDAPRGFGAHFWPPLHGIGTPGSGFRTKFRCDF